MNELFLKILNMSISASWLVLAVLLFRLVLKKAPKWINVVLWGIVAFRLICPFTIESPISLIPDSVGNGELVSEWMDDYIGEVSIIHDNSINYDAAVAAGREPISDGNGGYYVVTKNDQLGAPPTIENTVVPVLMTIWVIGVALLLLYTIISYLHLQQKVKTAIPLQAKIYQSENVCSPFVLGIIKPKIYLPFDMGKENLNHVIAHEQAHIRRKDHWWKPLGFLLLAVHWFNPLMWLAYVLLCRDIELACDEKVIKELGNEQRADYTQALLACSVKRRMIAACPLAFGEVGVKERVKSVMNYKKPAFWIIIVAIITCIVLSICFLTNPERSHSFSMEGKNVSDVEPQRIIENISDILKLDEDASSLHINANNFSIHLTSDFDFVDSEAILFFYTENQRTYSAQLRLFIDEGEYFVTEKSEWPEQQYIYLLRHYLDALHYLPQKEIHELSPDADQYIISMKMDGTPDSYSRTIAYTPYGVGDIDGWYIHLEIQPLHEQADGGYHGQADEVLHVFYGTDSVAFSTNFAGNYSLQQKMTLTETTPYWAITVNNQGKEAVVMEVEGEVYRIESGKCEVISSDKEWTPGTYSVSFAGAGTSRQMYGTAICTLLSDPKEIEAVIPPTEYGGQSENDWLDGISFSNLAPGEESVRSEKIEITSDGADFAYRLTYGRQNLTLTFGLRGADGTEYSREVVGGSDQGVIENIPIGSYDLFVRNSGDYSDFPAYINQTESYDATGAIVISIDN